MMIVVVVVAVAAAAAVVGVAVALVVAMMMMLMMTTCTYLSVLWNPNIRHYDHKRTFRIYSEPVQSSLCFQTLFL